MAAFGRPEYDRYVRLAEMMISFLRDHGYNYDANLDQDILDHDGPGVPSKMALTPSSSSTSLLRRI